MQTTEIQTLASEPADWTLPIPIHYGAGRIADLPKLCHKHGVGRPLFVTDRGSRGLPFIGEAIEQSRAAGMEPGLFAEVSPNPTDLEVVAGRHAFEVGRHDGIVAIGGGSGMDAGKAISLVAGRKMDLWDFDFDIVPPDLGADREFVPLFCIPTTAGTGAETESTAMITNSSRGIKGCVWHPLQKPRAAILDPQLTCGLPPSLTAWTGCDALVHAIEAYCVPGWNPMCDPMALEAMRLISRALPTAVNEPDNIAARGAMLVGSCLAGISFLKGLGLVHAISHMVGATFDTHHGLTNAIVLPVVLRFNRRAIERKVPQICAALGLERSDFTALDRAICKTLDDLGIPVRLADVGVDLRAASTLAHKASKDPAASTNPRKASVAEIEGLIVSAIERGR